MAQFDVFENPNIAQRGGFPYLVVLQSDQLDHFNTRLVMPLARLGLVPSTLPRRLTQTVVVDGEPLYLAAQLTASLPSVLLKRPVDSLRSQSAALIDAIDAVMSGV